MVSSQETWSGVGLTKRLPSDLAELYQSKRVAILSRLDDFAAVTSDQWFYELCFCLLTPQSSAVHANRVVEELKAVDYEGVGQDVLHILRAPDSYIRFHNTKHERLHKARTSWMEIRSVIERTDLEVRDRRDLLALTVSGFGLKESSHFMRNIGVRGLAIIDRHLLTNLVKCGLYPHVPQLTTASAYHSIEKTYSLYCECIGIDMDEVDLLFWCSQTGHILK